MSAESSDNARLRLIKTWRGPWIDNDRFEIGGEEFTASRRDVKTCSDGCKQKAYRHRKKEVKQNR